MNTVCPFCFRNIKIDGTGFGLCDKDQRWIKPDPQGEEVGIQATNWEVIEKTNASCAKIIPLGLDGRDGVQIIFVASAQKQTVISALQASGMFDGHVRQMRTREDGIEALTFNNICNPNRVKGLLDAAGVKITQIIR